jgi:hypothetical protein
MAIASNFSPSFLDLCGLFFPLLASGFNTTKRFLQRALSHHVNSLLPAIQSGQTYVRILIIPVTTTSQNPQTLLVVHSRSTFRYTSRSLSINLSIYLTFILDQPFDTPHVHCRSTFRYTSRSFSTNLSIHLTFIVDQPFDILHVYSRSTFRYTYVHSRSTFRYTSRSLSINLSIYLTTCNIRHILRP